MWGIDPDAQQCKAKGCEEYRIATLLQLVATACAPGSALSAAKGNMHWHGARPRDLKQLDLSSFSLESFSFQTRFLNQECECSS